MTSNLFKSDKKKFHDSIPFIAYVILISIILVIFITEKDVNLFFKDKLKRSFNLLSFTFIFLSTTFISMTLFLMLIPQITFHLSCILSPIIQIILSLSSKNFIIIGVIVFIAVIQLAIYIFSLKNRIKFNSVVLKKSLTHLYLYLPHLIILMLLGIAHITFITSLTIYTLTNDLISTVPRIIIITFALYWCFSNSIYFFVVLAASIVYLRVFKNKITQKSIFKISLFNTFLSIGSISLAGLLNLIILVLKSFVEKSNNKSKPVYSRIITILFLFLLNLTIDILEKPNKFMFPYLAVCNDSYFESIRNSYEMLNNGKNQNILNELIVEQLFFLSSLFIVLLQLIITGIIIKDIKIYLTGFDINFEFIGFLFEDKTLVCSVFIGICFMSFILGSAVKSFLFAFNADENYFKENYRDIFDFLENERRVKEIN
ncbi:Protein pns1 [Dictyocoela muelleri]|nr:Protein pns1 [Dictyocoela muelleri]